MKMKDEKEREIWQKYAKDKYGEPLAVVIRRLIEEDMKGERPRVNIKIEELLKPIREENYQYYKDLLTRLSIINDFLRGSTFDLTIEIDVIKGLIFQKIKEFYEENKDSPCNWESIELLENEISKIFQNIRI